MLRCCPPTDARAAALSCDIRTRRAATRNHEGLTTCISLCFSSSSLFFIYLSIYLFAFVSHSTPISLALHLIHPVHALYSVRTSIPALHTFHIWPVATPTHRLTPDNTQKPRKQRNCIPIHSTRTASPHSILSLLLVTASQHRPPSLISMSLFLESHGMHTSYTSRRYISSCARLRIRSLLACFLLVYLFPRFRFPRPPAQVSIRSSRRCTLYAYLYYSYHHPCAAYYCTMKSLSLSFCS